MPSSSELPSPYPVADLHLTQKARELASGVDALYLSGRGVVPQTLLDRLEEIRSLVELVSKPLTFELGGESLLMAPHAFGRYRYCLDHEHGRIGISPSLHLPPFRVQLRSSYLHTVGPAEAANRFRRVLEAECGDVQMSVSRIDLFADFEGWHVGINDRANFVCRAGSVRTFEEENNFTGFEFGRRSTKTVCARIYDKTADVNRTGADWWSDIWQRSNESDAVIRVELEWNREGLSEFGLTSVDETLAAIGDLWCYGTGEWLTHRSSTTDSNRARWPISQPWTCVQQATLTHRGVGAERVAHQQRAGSLRRLTPALVGYLVAFAALCGTTGIDDTTAMLVTFLQRDELVRGIAFADRVRHRVLEGWRR